MGYILSDNAAIHYEEYGGGHPLILLPGLLGTIENTWRRFVPDFARRFHTVVVDLRGHGKTNNPSGKLTIPILVRDLEHLVDTLGFEQVYLCGYSLGGYIGLAYGIRNPERVRGLIMHGTKLFWTQDVMTRTAEEMNPEILLRDAPERAEKLRNDHPPTAGEERWRELLDSSRELVAGMAANGIPVSSLPLARFPVLVSVGVNDTFVPQNEAGELARLLPDASVSIAPNAGHAMKTVEKDTFLSMALGFFNDEMTSDPPKLESGHTV